MGWMADMEAGKIACQTCNGTAVGMIVHVDLPGSRLFVCKVCKDRPLNELIERGHEA